MAVEFERKVVVLPPRQPSPVYRRTLIGDALSALPDDREAVWLIDILDELFALALTNDLLLNQNADNPVEHHTTVLDHAVRICVGEGFNSSEITHIAAPLSLLHDVWPVQRITRDMILNEPDVQRRRELERLRKESVPTHMREGAREARRILLELNRRCGQVVFQEDTITEVCRIIAIHDNPKIGIPIPSSDRLAVAFREADRLWMLTELGVLTDLARKKNFDPTQAECRDQVRSNLESFKEERLIYTGCPVTDFQDQETLLRTRTGFEMFEQIRAIWQV